MVSELDPRNRAEAAKAIQRTHFPFFLMRVFETLHPGEEELHMSWYLMAMCNKLATTIETPRGRAVISVPPRHLKSITTAVAFVAWCLGRNPGLKIMVATYSQDLAREHADACRQIMESSWYKALFPGTRIDPKKNRQFDFGTTAGGRRRSVSVTGSTTGFGADFIILDDCMKADDIGSEAKKDAVKIWYNNTMVPRLNNKKKGIIISIQQRLGEDDLTATLLDYGFDHLCLPAIGERDELFDIGFGRTHLRRAGDLLDPEREDKAALDMLRRELGPAVFAAQYQQNPIAPEGNLIRVDKFARYDGPIEREEFQKVVQSWDTGMSSLPTSDWSVCTTWGYLDRCWYLLDVLRAQLDYPDLRDSVIRMHRRWKADRVVIEDAGSGKSLWQELFRFKGALRPVMWPCTTSKEERLIGQLGQIEDGVVLLPNDAPWLDKFLHELRAFPLGRHDDQVDSMTQFLEFAMSRHAWANTEFCPKTGRQLYINRRPSPRSRR